MRQKFRMLLLIAVVTSMLLCSCSKGGEAKNEEKTNVVVGITQDLDSLDPHLASGAGTSEILYNLFDGLVKSDENGEFYPALASEYYLSEDKMTYHFILREGAKFHDGSLVTKADVVYSLKRLAGMLETKDPQVKTISAFSVINDIVETDNGVDVILSQPDTELISFFNAPILPKDYTEQTTKPIGAGPYKFVSYSPLESIVFEKFDDYYLQGVPVIDKVTFKICANSDAAFFELLANNIDVFPYLTKDQIAKLPDTYKKLSGDMNLVQALFLNNAVEPFNDIRVRQALCYAIDRQQIIDMVAGGDGQVIGSNMYPSLKKYYDETLVNKYIYSIDEAKRLLAEAGYENGFEFTIKVPSNYDFHVETAQVIVEMLKKVDVTAKIEQIEWASWLSDVYKGRDFQATVVGLDSELAPSDVFRFYPSDSSRNFMNYQNPEFDSILQAAKDTSDEDQKITYYKQLQQILAEDAVSVFIQAPAQFVAVNKKLDGYTFYPVFVQDISKLYFVK